METLTDEKLTTSIPIILLTVIPSLVFKPYFTIGFFTVCVQPYTSSQSNKHKIFIKLLSCKFVEEFYRTSSKK